MAINLGSLSAQKSAPWPERPGRPGWGKRRRSIASLGSQGKKKRGNRRIGRQLLAVVCSSPSFSSIFCSFPPSAKDLFPPPLLSFLRHLLQIPARATLFSAEIRKKRGSPSSLAIEREKSFRRRHFGDAEEMKMCPFGPKLTPFARTPYYYMKPFLAASQYSSK